MKNRKKYVWPVSAIITIIAVILLLGSKSGPEDILYPIRLNVWEPLLAKTKTNEVNKANYYLSVGDSRLRELASLKAQNKLNIPDGLKARDNFNNQTINVQNIILDLTKKESVGSKDVLQLSEDLDVQIEKAKAIFNIDQLEVLGEGVPVPQATSTKLKINKKSQ